MGVEIFTRFSDGITTSVLTYNNLTKEYTITTTINEVIVETSVIKETKEFNRLFMWMMLDVRFLSWSNVPYFNYYGLRGSYRAKTALYQD